MASVVARYAVNHLSAFTSFPGREGKSPALALKSLEVFISPCVVAFPPFPTRSNDSSHAHAAVALINPANERLEGAKFSPGDAHKYLPPLAGGDAFRYPLVYPEQCVDGLVHEAAGARLAAALAADYPVLKGEERERIRCRPGRAAVSRSYGGLVQNFGLIVHAVAPRFERGVDVAAWRTRLTSTWHSAMSKAHESGATFAVSPLLGSGGRGAPYADAADVAASAALSWRGHDDGASPTTALALQIVVQDDADADTLVGAIEARGATRID